RHHRRRQRGRPPPRPHDPPSSSPPTQPRLLSPTSHTRKRRPGRCGAVHPRRVMCPHPLPGTMARLEPAGARPVRSWKELAGTVPRDMYGEGRPSRSVDAGRLWTGGVATALVAALVAVVGVLIARGLLEVPVLAPPARAPSATPAPIGWPPS